MIDYKKIIGMIEDDIVNRKAKSTLLCNDYIPSHPTPYLHTRDSLLNLIVQLVKSAEKYDNNEYEYEGDDKFVYADEIGETFFTSVSDQWIQGLYIFKNYTDLLSTLTEWKQSDNDKDALNSLQHDPDLAIDNFE